MTREKTKRVKRKPGVREARERVALTLMLTPELRERLDAEARAQNRSRANFVENLMREWFDQRPK